MHQGIRTYAGNWFPNIRRCVVFVKSSEVLQTNLFYQVGDLLAYRLVELTASWTPELSCYRVSISLFTNLHIIVNSCK